MRKRAMTAIATGLGSKTTLADGYQIPMFGLGMYLNKADGTAASCVNHAIKHGYRLIDTAEIYRNEENVGEGIKKSGVKREDVFVVTKLWDQGYEKCKDAFRASLRKLDTGYVDLYLLHTPQKGKVVESYKAMLELQEQGLIRSVGVSNFDIHHLEGMKQAGLPTPAVNQFELHAFLKRRELVEYCRSNNITVMGYSPLCKGQKFDDPVLVEMAGRSVGVSNFDIHHLEGMKQAGLPTPAVNQFELHAFLKRRELVEYCRSNNITVMGYSPLCKGQKFDDPVLVEMAGRLGTSTAALLIRYSVQMGYITMPKTDKLTRIEENVQVFDWEIPQADMEILNSLPETSCTGAFNPIANPWEG